MDRERERQDASLYGGYYLSQPLIERNVRVAHSTSLTFLLLLAHHIFSRDCQEASLTCIRPHINEDVHTKPTPTLHNIPCEMNMPIYLVPFD